MYRDLSQPIETGMQTFPGDPDVSVSPAATVQEDGIAVAELRCGTHTGTHIDAPCHTEADGSDLSGRDIGEYVFDAAFVDVTPCAPREPIEAVDLPDMFTDGGKTADVLVVRTGYDAHWNTPSATEHPYLTPAAARELRDANCGVAVDSLNPDPTPTEKAEADEPDGFPVHHTLLGNDLPILENLTNLAGLPDRFTLYAFPLPIEGGDGSPVRAVAATE